MHAHVVIRQEAEHLQSKHRSEGLIVVNHVEGVKEIFVDSVALLTWTDSTITPKFLGLNVHHMLNYVAQGSLADQASSLSHAIAQRGDL
jgi:hypothetical protein